MFEPPPSARWPIARARSAFHILTFDSSGGRYGASAPFGSSTMMSQSPAANSGSEGPRAPADDAELPRQSWFEFCQSRYCTRCLRLLTDLANQQPVPVGPVRPALGGVGTRHLQYRRRASNHPCGMRSSTPESAEIRTIQVQVWKPLWHQPYL